jgi:RNA polymerase primary sigma factor
MDHDRVNQAVRRASEAAARTGEVTFDQLNALLPSDQFAPEQIEQVLAGLAEKGIRLVNDSERSNPVLRLLSELRRFARNDMQD